METTKATQWKQHQRRINRSLVFALSTHSQFFFFLIVTHARRVGAGSVDTSLSSQICSHSSQSPLLLFYVELRFLWKLLHPLIFFSSFTFLFLFFPSFSHFFLVVVFVRFLSTFNCCSLQWTLKKKNCFSLLPPLWWAARTFLSAPLHVYKVYLSLLTLGVLQLTHDIRQRRASP